MSNPLTLNLILEVQLSKIALRGKKTHPPCNLWFTVGPIPSGINVEDPHLLQFTDPLTRRHVTNYDHLLHDLAYEEFGVIRELCECECIAEDLTLVPQAIPAVLSVKAFAEKVGYAVQLFETCDY